MTRDKAAPLSSIVYDVAAGGVEHVPFTVQTNLSRALDAAKDAVLRRDDLLAFVAHDLRNPLSAIVMPVEYRLDSLLDDDDEQGGQHPQKDGGGFHAQKFR